MKNKIKFFVKQSAFTLMEIIIALTVVGLIAALIMPAVVTKYQTGVMEKAFNKQVTSIMNALEVLPTQEGVMEFSKSSMHIDATHSGGYESSSGNFLKKYFKLTRYCGSEPRLCFPSKYTEFSKSNGKSVVEPFKDGFNGSCGILKNGMSICIRPQIGDGDITGYIDVNGKSSPNVLGRDLREFTITTRGGTKMELGSTSTIWDTEDECDDTSKYNPSCCARWLSDASLWGTLSDNSKKKCCDTKMNSGTLDKDGVCCKFYEEIGGIDSEKPGLMPLACINKCSPEPTKYKDKCCGKIPYNTAEWEYICNCDMANPNKSCCDQAYTRNALNDDSKKRCCNISDFKSAHSDICPSNSSTSCGEPSTGKANYNCCVEWQNAGTLKSNISVANQCCKDYNFYMYEYHGGDSTYCTRKPNCGGTFSWRVTSPNSYNGRVTIYPGSSGDYLCRGMSVFKFKVAIGVDCPGHAYGQYGVHLCPSEFYAAQNPYTSSCLFGSNWLQCRAPGYNSPDDNNCEIYYNNNNKGYVKISDRCEGSYEWSWPSEGYTYSYKQ